MFLTVVLHVAVVAESFGVERLLRVARGLLKSTILVIAVLAHTFRVELAVRVAAVGYLVGDLVAIFITILKFPVASPLLPDFTRLNNGLLFDGLKRLLLGLRLIALV